MKSWIFGIYLLCISAITMSVIPISVQGASELRCTLLIRSGKTLNWISVVDGRLSNRGTLTIRRVRSGATWSGTLAFTSVNAPSVQVTGELEGSQMEMLKPDTTQRWDATCFDGFIAGQFDRKPNDIFLLFPRR